MLLLRTIANIRELLHAYHPQIATILLLTAKHKHKVRETNLLCPPRQNDRSNGTHTHTHAHIWICAHIPIGSMESGHNFETFRHSSLRLRLCRITNRQIADFRVFCYLRPVEMEFGADYKKSRNIAQKYDIKSGYFYDSVEREAAFRVCTH